VARADTGKSVTGRARPAGGREPGARGQAGADRGRRRGGGRHRWRWPGGSRRWGLGAV